MEKTEVLESDTFGPLRTVSLVFWILGYLGIAVGLFIMFFGFRANGVEYSGPVQGLSAILSSVWMIGIAHLMWAIGTLGDGLRSTQVALQSTRDQIALAIENRKP